MEKDKITTCVPEIAQDILTHMPLRTLWPALCQYLENSDEARHQVEDYLLDHVDDLCKITDPSTCEFIWDILTVAYIESKDEERKQHVGVCMEQVGNAHLDYAEGLSRSREPKHLSIRWEIVQIVHQGCAEEGAVEARAAELVVPAGKDYLAYAERLCSSGVESDIVMGVAMGRRIAESNPDCDKQFTSEIMGFLETHDECGKVDVRSDRSFIETIFGKLHNIGCERGAAV